MATTNTHKEEKENPKKTLTQSSSDPHPTPRTQDPPSLSNANTVQRPPSSAVAPDATPKDSPDESKPSTGPETLNNSTGGPATDIQKKIRRAERFGMSVQLSEAEKRNSRAERFGTAPSLQGSDKKSEEQKRKARAERFGLAQSGTADEEAKKKARLARFAQDSKTESLEEDKKKARAIRFSEPSSSSSPSQVNGKGNIEPKTAIAGKAGGVA